MPASVWILWTLQTVYLVRWLGQSDSSIESVPRFLAELAATCFSVWVFGWIVALAVPRNRILAFAATLAFVVFYVLLLLFHWHSGGHFDWGVIWRFRRDLLDPEVRGMAGSFVGLYSYAFVGLALAGAAVFEVASAAISRPRRPAFRWTALTLFACAAAFLTFGPRLAGDEITASLRSVRGAASLDRLVSRAAEREPYPYVRRPSGAIPSQPGSRPHVFLVAIESFNSNFVEARTGDGREYTPFFNSLIPRGVYVENFHGNSMESARGQLPLLCSLWPSMRGRVFDDYRGIRLHCLPEILGENGYRTIFDQGARYLRFEDTGRFMADNGFSVVRAAMERTAPNRREGAVWGWGLQDDVFFEEFFAFLDSEEAAAKKRDPGSDPRYFAFLATISSHFPDNQIPSAQRYLFPSTSGGKAGYGNSIYLADRYLRTFFRELRSRPYLKDSIVVLTGDHSFPAGEHGNAHSQLGFYEEVYRTPLLILWNGRLAARRVRGELWSQIDVAPTILDLLGLDVPNHFLGRSILRGFDPARDRVHLVQPYDGTYLSVLAGDLKYVLSVATGEEMIFNLRRDPREQRNLIAEYRDSPEIAELRREIGRLVLNQKLTEENRIWPPDGVSP